MSKQNYNSSLGTGKAEKESELTPLFSTANVCLLTKKIGNLIYYAEYQRVWGPGRHRETYKVFDEVPQFLSISLASALCGLSRKTFTARFIGAGLVKPSTPVGLSRAVIPRWDLEEGLGRKFTLKDCLEAERRLAATRRYQRDYERRQNRKGNH